MMVSKRSIIVTSLVLTLMSTAFGADSKNSAPVAAAEDGVSGFLNRLEGAVAEKTLWFYRHFGQNLNRNKIVGTAAENSCAGCA